MPGSKCTVLLLTLLLTLSACSQRQLVMPASGGRPYDVVVVGDQDTVVAPMLTQETPGLPQSEPLFTVVQMRGNQLSGSARLARSIVVVETDSSRYDHTSINYVRNVYARPQRIVYITAPSAQSIAQEVRPKVLQLLLMRHEMGISIDRLRRKHNKKLSQRVSRTFGVEMLIPHTMKKVKQGDGFLWMSDNRPDCSTNICIYTSENRDSVMHINIKGETDQMYMATVEGSTLQSTLKKGKQSITVKRGLWQMEGDAMGGPWVSHTLEDAQTGRVVVAEAFVYAPGHDKRNLLFEAEAALMTMKPAAKTSATETTAGGKKKRK